MPLPLIPIGIGLAKGAKIVAPKVVAGGARAIRGLTTAGRKAGRVATTAGTVAAAGAAGLNALEAATGGRGNAGAEASKAVDTAQAAITPIGDTYEDMRDRKKSKEEFKENIQERLAEDDAEEDEAEQRVAELEERKQEKGEALEDIRRRLEEGEVLSDEVLKVLIDTAGLPQGVPADWEHSCTRINLNNGIDDTDAAVLEQIAEHCRNHLYTYKPEAAAIVPGLDTQTPQVGPTAQEIEQVNPAAVNTDPATGAKFVDTQKLTMTLAGALGELARKVRQLENDSRWRDDMQKIERKEENQRVYLGNWGDR